MCVWELTLRDVESSLGEKKSKRSDEQASERERGEEGVRRGWVLKKHHHHAATASNTPPQHTDKPHMRAERCARVLYSSRAIAGRLLGDCWAIAGRLKTAAAHCCCSHSTHTPCTHAVAHAGINMVQAARRLHAMRLGRALSWCRERATSTQSASRAAHAAAVETDSEVR